MKTKRQKKIVHTSRNWATWKFAIVLIILLLVGLTATSSKKQQTRSQTEPKASVYSVEQLHAFWDNKLKSIAQDQWAISQIPYPEVNERCKKLHAQIIEHSRKALQISMVTNYHWASVLVEAAAGFDHSNNAVSISLYIPSILDSHLALERSKNPLWRKLFVSHQIILLMHELEHAANADISNSRAIDIAEESRAWAETCRHTIVPLVDTYQLPIHNIEVDLYKSWKQCNGDTNSPIWKQAIVRHYGGLDKKDGK